MQYLQLLELLQGNADDSLKGFNEKLYNSAVPVIGCRIPFLRRTAKSISAEQAEQYPLHQFVEVDMIKGLVLTSKPLAFEKRGLLWDFAHSLENWAVCDTCKARFPAGENRYLAFFGDMAAQRRQFVCRYGLVNLMSFLKEDVASVIKETEKVTAYGSYYADMGMAWLLATAMAYNSDEVKKFMCRRRDALPDFVVRKALQKMRESFRVSEEDKRWTLTFGKE